MEWFDGGVLNAITKCREEKALLIVYVYGKTISLYVHLDIIQLHNHVQYIYIAGFIQKPVL